jgi:soluble lytic murein transglycosylase-like protein
MEYVDSIWRNGVANLVDPAIIAAVIEKESAGHPKAKGAAGEVGLMQILPGTAEQYCGVGWPKLEIPDINIRCGARFLRFLHEKYNGNVAAMLVAYNAGPGAVQVVGGAVVGPARSKRYAGAVMALVPRYRDLIRAYGEASAYYGWMFPPGDWVLNNAALEGIVASPRWGYRQNLARYEAGMDPAGACPWGPMGIGARIGTRQFLQGGLRWL